jgi:hypothetical protein
MGTGRWHVCSPRVWDASHASCAASSLSIGCRPTGSALSWAVSAAYAAALCLQALAVSSRSAMSILARSLAARAPTDVSRRSTWGQRMSGHDTEAQKIVQIGNINRATGTYGSTWAHAREGATRRSLHQSVSASAGSPGGMAPATPPQPPVFLDVTAAVACTDGC